MLGQRGQQLVIQVSSRRSFDLSGNVRGGAAVIGQDYS